MFFFDNHYSLIKSFSKFCGSSHKYNCSHCLKSYSNTDCYITSHTFWRFLKEHILDTRFFLRMNYKPQPLRYPKPKLKLKVGTIRWTLLHARAYVSLIGCYPEKKKAKFVRDNFCHAKSRFIFRSYFFQAKLLCGQNLKCSQRSVGVIGNAEP